MLDIRYNESFKYGQLAHALAKLEFQEKTGTTDLGIPFRLFYNKAHDAMIALPKLDDTDLLEPIHLRRAEKTLEDRGVTDSATFFGLLREAGQKAA